MNFYKIVSTLLFLAAMLLISTCKKDPDPQPKPPTPEELFYTNCGLIPPVVGCINGARVFVPNAFTPNNDGINDVLIPWAGDGIKEVVSFKVFDDNGNIVHEALNFRANDPNFGWDGKLLDGSIQDGIYNYSISFITDIDETAEFEGAACVRTSIPINCVENEKHLAWGTQYDGNGGFDFNLPSYEDCE